MGRRKMGGYQKENASHPRQLHGHDGVHRTRRTSGLWKTHLHRNCTQNGSIPEPFSVHRKPSPGSFYLLQTVTQSLWKSQATNLRRIPGRQVSEVDEANRCLVSSCDGRRNAAGTLPHFPQLRFPSQHEEIKHTHVPRPRSRKLLPRLSSPTHAKSQTGGPEGAMQRPRMFLDVPTGAREVALNALKPHPTTKQRRRDVGLRGNPGLRFHRKLG